MHNSRKQVILGFLGSQLDSGKDEYRWEKWRPTIALGQHEDFLVDRFELLVEPHYKPLGELVASDFRGVSPETTFNLVDFPLKDPWDFEEVFSRLHEFARRYPFHPDDEDYLIHITTGTHVAQICLFLLAESRHIPARLLQTSPPSRGRKGVGHYRIIDLDLSRYDALAMRFEQEQREDLTFLKSGIETRDPHFNALIERIEQVAISSKAPLLIHGATGAGKSQLARRIYELKRRRQQLAGEFIEVNCATIRGDQAMSALFGHVKGAYTGALGHRPGLLKAADSGLLFLDEIGELGLDEQAMLLRAIEEKRFLPVGSDNEVSSNFQLIAGTNRDLRREIDRGRFREDLLARINLWTFKLPTLAERRRDIAPNLNYELDRFTAATGQTVRLNKEARERFLQFAESPAALWKGNFRDL
ncbi:MAG: RNA repair transcriptional activator RtcR, partial [Planctomycetaceae bacterium]|nr:RNA repair transcriptional activator RtcR [Planctomycetaceae bacterium]